MTLACKNLSFERNDAVFFNSIDFALQHGELLQVRGVNGSGKSTLLRIIAGYIEPEAGAVTWQNKNIFEHREQYQTQLQYIGHHNGIKSYLTPSENLALSCALSHRKPQAQQIRKALEKMRLANLIESQAQYLSAGQCRRLALARLLLNPSALWILDEPTTALDSEGQDLLMNMLDEHLAAGGIAVVATHHPLHLKRESKTIEIGGQDVER